MQTTQNNLEKYKVTFLPEGRIGKHAIERFIVTEKDEKLQQLRLANPSSLGRMVPKGTYTKLLRFPGSIGNATSFHDSVIVMSDTPDEIADHIHFIERACGRVLINGLGLGITLNALLQKPDVLEIFVVELEQDVINLVGPTYLELARVKGIKLELINADALDYRFPSRMNFDCVWHDIWDTICGDNVETMSKLHRKYGRQCARQDSWCRELVKHLKDRCY